MGSGQIKGKGLVPHVVTYSKLIPKKHLGAICAKHFFKNLSKKTPISVMISPQNSLYANKKEAVLAKFFLGGYLGLSENLGGSTFFAFFVFYCIFMSQFFGPYTSPPPSPPVCIYDFLNNLPLSLLGLMSSMTTTTKTTIKTTTTATTAG